MVVARVPAVHAGVELTTELADATEAGKSQSRPSSPGRIQLESDRLRMELTRQNGSEAVLIFRGDRNVMWSVNDKRRTYTEVDRARMQEMVAQSDATRKQMEKDFDKVPPEKRAEMLRLLAQGAPKKKREPPTIQPTGRTDKVGGIPCHEVEVLRNGEKLREVCVADWKATGIGKADLGALRDLNTFEDDTVGALGARTQDDALELFEMLDGLPVRVRTFRAGQPRTELRVVKIERKAIDAQRFEVPAGYTRREFKINMPGQRHLPPGTGSSSGGVLPPGSK
ncbi:MAG TPA: DUF4412 domain-containing protein [Candidatus Binatia bacterium]|jgi:hypothetical protein